MTASDGRLTVTLPEDALKTSAVLTVRTVTDAAAGPLIGAAYDLGPEGVAFAEPALLAFRIDDPAMRERARRGELVVARLESEGWVPLPQSWTDDDGAVVLGLTPHFSRYGVAAIGPCPASLCAPRELCFQGECYATCRSDTPCDEEDPCYNPLRCGARACQTTTCDAGEQCFFGACYARCSDDADCGAAEACVASRCVDTGAEDAGPPPPVDAGPADAGPADAGPPPPIDAGPTDAGPPPPIDAGPSPECVTDVDCAASESCLLDTCIAEGVCVALPQAPGTTFDPSAGYLEGTWFAYIEPPCLDAFTEHLATLFLLHAASSTAVDGTYRYEPTGATGNLGGSNFIGDVLTTSFFVTVDDSSEVIGFSGCVSVAQNEMSCRISSTVTGTVVDGVLLRQ